MEADLGASPFSQIVSTGQGQFEEKTRGEETTWRGAPGGEISKLLLCRHDYTNKQSAGATRFTR